MKNLFWSIETTNGQDVSYMIVGIILGLGIHWSIMIGMLVLHFALGAPKEPGAWLDENP